MLGKRTRTLAVTSTTTVSAFELFETESLLRVRSNSDSPQLNFLKVSITRAESGEHWQRLFSENRLTATYHSSVHSECVYGHALAHARFCFFEFREECFSNQRLTCMIACYRSSHLFGVCARVSTNQEGNRSLFHVKQRVT